MTNLATDHMISGFARFRKQYYEQQPDLMRDLIANGQKPAAIVIACSDSRVDPAILTQAKPGEMFVVRNVGALTPSYDQAVAGCCSVAAALEYGVRALKVREVVVFAHSSCGGMAALARPENDRGREFVNSWTGLAHDCRHTGAKDPDDVGQRALALSLRNVRSYPFVAEAVAAHHLTVHGWWFDMTYGRLLRLNEASGELEPLVAA